MMSLLRKYAKGRSGIIFVWNEEHAQIVCNIFRERGMVAKTYLDAKVFGYCYKKGRDKVEMVELGTLDEVIYKMVKTKTEK